MYRLENKKAKEVIEGSKVHSAEDEKHFLFGRNDVFSFEEDSSVYIVVETDKKDYLIHDFVSMGDKQRKKFETDKSQAVRFLNKTGHTPFMRFDITRFKLEKHGQKFVIEEVKQLGFFTDMKDLGMEGINYGEILKDQMIKDTEKEKKVRKGAKEILKSS